jgi:HrpA-like RNA helicase
MRVCACPHAQEIDQAVTRTKDYIADMQGGMSSDDVWVLPLYSSLPHHLQIKAIAPAPRHVKRKVLCSPHDWQQQQQQLGPHCAEPEE